jgi:hypothetical protein
MEYVFKDLDERRKAYVAYATVQAPHIDISNGTIDVVLTVDGVEVDFIRVCDRIMENADHGVEMKAAQIIRDRACEIVEFLTEVEEAAVRLIENNGDPEAMGW